MEGVDLSPIQHDDLEPIVIPVKFRGQDYLLREADEDASVKINNARIAAARFQDGELERVEKAAEVQPLAISLCLTKVDGPGKTSKVDITTLKTWPARFTKRLYDKIMEISGMDDKKTLAQIDKEIARLQKKRANLIKELNAPKDLPEPTEVTSD